jgi:hypothetical protein
MTIITSDASTPAVAQGTGTGVLTSASFTPPDATMVLVLAAAGWSTTATTIACSDSGSHTWSNPVTAQGTSGAAGNASIFYCYFTRSPGAITVSLTYTGFSSGSGGRFADIIVLKGANPNQTGAGVASLKATTGTAATVSITTTKAGSWVWGVTDNCSSSYTYTSNANTGVDATYTDTTDSVSLLGLYGLNYTGTTPGAITMGGTWSNSSASNTAFFEVLPALDLPHPPMIVNTQAIRSAYL